MTDYIQTRSGVATQIQTNYKYKNRVCVITIVRVRNPLQKVPSFMHCAGADFISYNSHAVPIHVSIHPMERDGMWPELVIHRSSVIMIQEEPSVEMKKEDAIVRHCICDAHRMCSF